MDVLDLLSSEFACSRLFRAVRWRGGVYCPKCGSRSIKGHGGVVLNAISVGLVGGCLTIRQAPYSTILG